MEVAIERNIKDSIDYLVETAKYFNEIIYQRFYLNNLICLLKMKLMAY
ncbi:MAG: hypothetical protein M9949_02235 [Candidatus Kapabacteria bacterium]|nr:hypothetical protein [Candidatus Kapabacteria bacterium]